MARKDKQYAKWNTESSDPDEHYWELYDSIADAVCGDDEPVEIFEMNPKSIGFFKQCYKVVKVKKRK